MVTIAGNHWEHAKAMPEPEQPKQLNAAVLLHNFSMLEKYAREGRENLSAHAESQQSAQQARAIRMPEDGKGPTPREAFFAEAQRMYLEFDRCLKNCIVVGQRMALMVSESQPQMAGQATE